MKENKCNFVIKFIILTSQRGSKALTSSSCSTNITRVFSIESILGGLPPALHLAAGNRQPNGQLDNAQFH